MLKPLFAFVGAAVVMTGASVAPADASPKVKTKTVVCTKWRNGTCVKSHTVVRSARAMPRARYRVGYRFGPDYSYTTYSTIPTRYVSRYNLNPDYRYVYNGNTLYVVDPTTYAITRILNGIVR
ncbi:MAG: hypothetical protein V4513_02590 [Pseudomonadota bacterium]